MDDSTHIVARTVVALSLTYCIHSTLLIGGVWLVHRCRGMTSHALSERMWKMAALLGLVTAPLQVLCALHGPGMRVPLKLETTHVAKRSERSNLTLPVTGWSPDWRQPREGRQVDQPVERLNPTTSQLANQHQQATPDERQAITSGVNERHSIGGLPGEELPTLGETSASMTIDDWVTDVDPIELSLESTSTAATHTDPSSRLTATPKTKVRIAPVNQLTSRWSAGLFLVNVFAAVLLAVMGAGASLLMIQSVTMRRRFASAALLDAGRPRRILDRLQRRCRLRRRVHLIASQRCSEPVSFGLRRWTIALPVGLAEQLESSELRALFAHELAHLSRGDVRWLWIGRVLCSVLAFQPLNRVARRRWQQASEFCCDDWAIDQGQSHMDLARCLTRVSEWRLDGPESSIALAATGGRASVVRRVERLVHPTLTPDRWTNSWRQRCLITISCLVGAGVVWAAPHVAYSIDMTKGTMTLTPAERQVKDAVSVTQAADPIWESCNDQLAQLERDVRRVEQLLQNVSRDNDLEMAVNALRERIEELRRRRAILQQLLADHTSKDAVQSAISSN